MPSEVLQLTATWETANGDPAINQFYVVHRNCTVISPSPEPFTDALAAQQAHQLATAWAATMVSSHSSSAAMLSVAWVWNENIDSGPLHEGTTTAAPLPVDGTAGGEPLPLGITIACRLQTGLGGRGNHGRFFLIGIPLSAVQAADPDILTDAYANALTSNLAAFLAAFNNNDCVAGVGDQFNWSVVSFTLNHALRATASYHSVTAANLSDRFVDYQRRRSLGHARHH